MIPLWQAEDVIRATAGTTLHAQNWQARDVAIDSREVKEGDLFIALRGPSHDAHKFVHQAFEQGAAAAIVERAPEQTPQTAPLVFVSDTLKALQDLGDAGRSRCNAPIVAITGSVGKTTCKELLALALNAVHETHANVGSFNNLWGVPLSLARLPQTAGYGIFEIGMNHAGEITPLTKAVKPDVALITTIEAVHLDFFPNLEAIADAKAEIFLGMKPSGKVVLNKDNPHFARLAAAARAQDLKTILAFGKDAKADARLLSFENTNDGMTVKASVLGHALSYHLGAQGLPLALNSVACLLTAAAAGADPEICAEALSAFRPLGRRGETKKVLLSQNEQITIVDETFNASPIATAAAINLLGETPVSQGRRIVVVGDMRELGPKSPEFHAALATNIVQAGIDKVFCCGELMAHLFEALPTKLRGGYALTSADLAPLVVEEAHANDRIMIKGSKSMHMEIIVEALENLSVSSKQKKAV